ncbi:MAG TPA: type II toxin-antitoxin system VapB family antitoxin [Geminicoccaceae bacterium]|nr:type II toxin-antitoxin system VapB family antitoxin [Geminicoccus sp.]HMU53181.1 type II toxin-antitoxin system VapB family antitoxin [Geminicoccaceae bacterium]
MALYIRDNDVHVLAQQLAAARHSTVTDAVRHALHRELADIEAERARRDGQLRQLFEEFDRTPPISRFGDDEMYDEDGLPR